MRVAIVSEIFLPTVNGVTNSVCRVTEHLRAYGHEVLIIAAGSGPSSYEGAQVEWVPSFGFPGYQDVRIGVPSGRVARLIEKFQPDVVHLAAPVFVGRSALKYCKKAGIPTVSIFQTDLAGFSQHYVGNTAVGTIWRWLRSTHELAGVTLAPSSSTVMELRRAGISQVHLWPRGVDLVRFNALHRDEELRRHWSPTGRLIVGYVGRLANEKQVELLADLADSDCDIVIVGDGPARAELARSLPNAHFAGFQSGQDLARHVASLDIFVHTGVHETFCQAVQEALSAGVPAVVPGSGGPLDLVNHEQNGLVYEPGSGPDLVASVKRLLDDPELLKALKAQARTSVQHRTWPAVMARLDEHYADQIRLVKANRTRVA